MISERERSTLVVRSVVGQRLFKYLKFCTRNSYTIHIINTFSFCDYSCDCGWFPTTILCQPVCPLALFGLLILFRFVSFLSIFLSFHQFCSLANTKFILHVSVVVFFFVLYTVSCLLFCFSLFFVTIIVVAVSQVLVIPHFCWFLSAFIIIIIITLCVMHSVKQFKAQLYVQYIDNFEQ